MIHRHCKINQRSLISSLFGPKIHSFAITRLLSSCSLHCRIPHPCRGEILKTHSIHMGLNGEGKGSVIGRGRKRSHFWNHVRNHSGPALKRQFEGNFRSERSKTGPAVLSEEDDGDDEEVDDGIIPDLDGDSLKAMADSSMDEAESFLSKSRFDQCDISPLTLKGIKAAGCEMMTIVQEATLPFILQGKDVLAKAKTGTGKTLAFLVPAIEVVAKLDPVGHGHKNHPINVLVICPTRELADQATKEAGKLLKYHHSIGVQLVIGGTKMTVEQKHLQDNLCQILVATPGRLRDHIENTTGFSSQLMGVKVLVLDEADRLLDMGFRKDIEKIIAAVPKQRQTLLFSATVSDEIRDICYIAMKGDREFIDTVGKGCEQTHSQVRQLYVIAPLDQQFLLLYNILADHIAEDAEYKVIVFCTTAKSTKLVADLLSRLKLNVREIHSRKSQSYRTKVSNEFRQSKALILVSSDVSARGVDYPNVTLVVQLGLPTDREQYIHRLGRTGRRGKEGKGMLILAPFEEYFLNGIRDLPIENSLTPHSDLSRRNKVEKALSEVKMDSKASAYQAWVGYYNSIKTISKDKTKLVQIASDFSKSMGLEKPPSIPANILRKMGLANVPGLSSKKL